MGDTFSIIKTQLISYLIGAILIIGILVALYYYLSQKFNNIFPSIEIGTKKLGESCATHASCAGWIAGKAGTPGCCNGKCTTLQKDWVLIL